MTVEPWAGCPPCPQCKAHCGTREGQFTATAYARSQGPSWLSCSHCGATWEASPEDVAQAERADAAWTAECKRQRDERGPRMIRQLLDESGADAVGHVRDDGSIEYASRR